MQGIYIKKKNYGSESLMFPESCMFCVGTSCLRHSSCWENEEQVVTQQEEDLYDILRAESENQPQERKKTRLAMTDTSSGNLQGLKRSPASA